MLEGDKPMTGSEKPYRFVKEGLVALALLMLAACPRLPGSPADAGRISDARVVPDLASPPDLPAIDGAASPDQGAACPTSKIAFAQAAGCSNDGSNEFCIPKGDAATLMEVKRIASSVSCGPGRGRAGCDPTRQDLCFFPTDISTCTGPHGALTDAAWAQHCQIATLPSVPQIVHTFFE
jgi:hypothetical protein